MINRVLIRIKVIQILYSYLLTRSEFKIESAPETTSRDRRFAYTVYVRMLLLMLELSGYNVRNGSQNDVFQPAAACKPLSAGKMARALANDDAVRRLILKGNSGVEAFDDILKPLFDTITATDVYKTFSRKRKREIADDVAFWATILQTVIARDPKVEAAARRDPEFTLRGFENGINMLVGTLKGFNDNRSLLKEARSALETSLERAYHLYIALLLLPAELTRLEEERLEAGRNKHLPSPDDLNPNTRFVENAYVEAVLSNPSLSPYLEKNLIDWKAEPMLLRSLLDNIRQSDIYKEYMEAPTTDIATDCELWRQIMRTVVLPSDELAEMLEDKSVYWNDDLDIVGTFVMKTIRRFATSLAEGETPEIMPQFKDEEDERFGADLFTLAVDNRDDYRQYIDRFINREQWDTERLAFMDIVIMITAIAEILNYPLIPIPVTLNEYIEIANCYSTPKSGQFINGILYSVINCLKEEGRLQKEF